MTLQGRPLYDNTADAALFVHRPEWNRLHRSIDNDLNVLLTGGRGHGKTSLLRQVQHVHRADDDERRIVYVDGTAVDDPLELATRIRSAVAGQPSPVVAGFESLRAFAPDPDPPPAGASQRFHDELAALNEVATTTVLVDASGSGDALYGVFGRMRDVLWQLPHRWVVAVDDEDRSTLLNPPADAFFDSIIEMQPWETQELIDLLERRAPEYNPELRVRIAAGADRSPRVALRALRDAIIDERDPTAALSERSNLLAAAAQVGRPHATVLGALLDRGPASPSDEALQSSLRLSRGRLAAILAELADQGLVVTKSESSRSPGRPRTVYVPNLEER